MLFRSMAQATGEAASSRPPATPRGSAVRKTSSRSGNGGARSRSSRRSQPSNADTPTMVFPWASADRGASPGFLPTRTMSSGLDAEVAIVAPIAFKRAFSASFFSANVPQIRTVFPERAVSSAAPRARYPGLASAWRASCCPTGWLRSARRPAARPLVAGLGFTSLALSVIESCQLQPLSRCTPPLATRHRLWPIAVGPVELVPESVRPEPAPVRNFSPHSLMSQRNI